MKLEFEGEVLVTVNGNCYECYVTALADYRYEQGKMYMRNGDPGYPDDEELDIISLSVSDISRIEDDTGVHISVDNPDTVAAVIDAVEDHLYEMDLDNWYCPELAYEED